MSSAEIVPAPANTAAALFEPVMGMQQAVNRYNLVLSFTKTIMKEGKDYGVIPGVERPSLLKPGAEKLCSFFGLTPQFAVVKEIEQWDSDEPFFYYWYKCLLRRGDTVIAEGDGSCNSHESKYRYRWVGEDQLAPGMDPKRLLTRRGRISEFDFAIEKAETTGKYGKPPAYWQNFRDAIKRGAATRVMKKTQNGTRPAWEIDATVYRVPNPDISDQVNTFQKMAQKRALIAAALIACNASEFYTQDLEDLETIDPDYTAAEPEPPRQQAPEPPPPSPDPAPPADNRSSMTLEQVLSTFTNTKTIEEAFRQMKEHFVRILPENVYDQILAEGGLGPGEARTVGKARKTFSMLWHAYKKALEERAAESAAAPPPEEEVF